MRREREREKLRLEDEAKDRKARRCDDSLRGACLSYQLHQARAERENDPAAAVAQAKRWKGKEFKNIYNIHDDWR